MSFTLQIYSETLRDNRWIADKAKTFERRSLVGGEHVVSMNHAISARNAVEYMSVFPVLAMGVAGLSHPFDMPIKGLPPVLSSEVKALWQEDCVDGAKPTFVSYQTYKALHAKSLELVLRSDERAVAMRKRFNEFLKVLYPNTMLGNLDHYRIVYWFT